ncbi:3182_t:CDS:1 [Acaulospora morrowiae]|uniref:3182_t:CDS:1 n=1 Tax=Acaulospora morrowiae TaxID=94023 RepID=A0A9N9H3U6_9GLOM|nr:3182_t:CDS:1 [Acaulospora morrowiae]
MSNFKNLPSTTIVINTTPYQASQDYLFSSPVVIFPDEMINEEPTSIEEGGSCYIPSPMDRRIERYKKLRAIHERAGRLPKSPVSENESRNSSHSSTSSNPSEN